MVDRYLPVWTLQYHVVNRPPIGFEFQQLDADSL